MFIFESGLNCSHIWEEPPCLLWEHLFLLVRWTILHPPLLCLQCLLALHTLILNPLPLFKTCLDIIIKKASLILSCLLPSGWATGVGNATGVGIGVLYHICYLCCSTVYVSPSPKLLWALWRWGLVHICVPCIYRLNSRFPLAQTSASGRRQAHPSYPPHTYVTIQQVRLDQPMTPLFKSEKDAPSS